MDSSILQGQKSPLGVHELICLQEYQEDMKLDEDQLTSEVAKTQSASDTRPSSTTLGFSGILFAGAVLVLIVAVDAVTLFSYLCARSIRNQRQD